jgi:hypothetical protein
MPLRFRPIMWRITRRYRILLELRIQMSVNFRPAEGGDIDAMATIRAREWETEAYWKRRIGAYI